MGECAGECSLLDPAGRGVDGPGTRCSRLELLEEELDMLELLWRRLVVALSWCMWKVVPSPMSTRCMQEGQVKERINQSSAHCIW